MKKTGLLQPNILKQEKAHSELQQPEERSIVETDRRSLPHPLQEVMPEIHSPTTQKTRKGKPTKSVQEKNESLYRKAIEVSGAVPYYQNYLTDAYEFVGPGIQNLLGYSTEEFTPQLWEKITLEISLWGELKNYTLEEAVQKARGCEGVSWQADYCVRTRSGETRWIMNAAIQVFNDSGQVIGSLGILQDITERKKIEKALRISETSQRTIPDAVEDAIFIHDIQTGKILDINFRASEMYGYTPEELHTIDVELLSAGVPPYSQAEAISKIQAAIQGKFQKFEWLAKGKCGNLFWVEVCLKRVTIDGRERLMASVRDISERKKSEEQNQVSAQFLKNTFEGVLITDSQGIIEVVNPAFTDITGYTAEEVLGKKPNILKSQHHPPDFYQKMWRSLIEKGFWQDEIWNRRKSGESYPEWLTITAIKDSRNQTTHYVSIFHDITETKRAQEQIKYHAYHDALTGLPNRQLLYDRLHQALVHAKRNHEQVGILFLDLDNFKGVNDQLGHEVGDLLLKEASRRLSSCVRAVDTVARLGGDEFVVVLTEISEHISVQGARRILEILSEPFLLHEHEIHVGASIGLALYPADGNDPETLVKNADLAMYQAKRQGKNNYKLFTSTLNKVFSLRFQREQELRNSLKQGDFRVYYQPKINLQTGAITGIEALVRWHSPENEIVSAKAFLGIVEESGLIIPIGDWVLKQACQEIRNLQEQGFPGLKLSVNLSERQFYHKHLHSALTNLLNETGFPPQCLELEFTEKTLMKNLESARIILKNLKELGIHFTLDNYGIGCCSLYHLQAFHIQNIKVDPSFIKTMIVTSESASIVEAMIAVAHTLRLNIIGQGVETSAQLQFLQSKNCCEAQGFLISHPLPGDKLPEYLHEGNLLKQLLST